MKKIISYCLYGESPVYLRGAIKNIELAQVIYPDWISRFYVFEESFGIIPEILSYSNTEVVKIDKKGGAYSMLYRFLPIGETDVEYFISRDTDSRLSIREMKAVEQWILSGKTFHSMKDHPYHYCETYPILGGMWGAKGGIIPNISQKINEWNAISENKKGSDQHFLHGLYHSMAKNDMLLHGMDDFPIGRNLERDKISFIGQPLGENDDFVGDWKNDLRFFIDSM